MKRIARILPLLLTLLAGECFADTPAFPGAEGFGMYTTGGRGGKVYHVTTLEDNGQVGSLRYAVGQSGPRTIVFDVSGTIELTSRLNITKGDLTIAGQTAPGDGICLKNYETYLNADNVIIRFIRFRLGTDKPDVASDGTISQDRDAIWGRNRKNIILDHCSMSWCTDECASFYGNQNFTMQWCLVAESLRGSIHPKGYHGYGGIWGGQGASFHHNLVAHHDSRTPRLCGSRYSNEPDKELVDLRNNVFYNWGNTNSGYAGEGGSYNFVNNYYKSGPATKSSIKYRIFEPWADDGKNSQPQGVYGHYYVKGNYMEDKGDNWDWNGFDVNNSNNGSMNKSSITSYSEYKVTPVSTHTAKVAYEKVLKYAGASLHRDAVDQRIANETKSRSYTYKGSVLGGLGIIDKPSDVGGWPTLKSASAPKDSDGDGIPDSWESAHGLNPNNASDGNATNAEGYTNLELYMNSLVCEMMSDGVADALNSVSKITCDVTTNPGAGNQGGETSEDDGQYQPSATANHGKYDFVVGVDGNFAAAKAAAEASSKSRFIIFFPNGNYNIGTLTGNENQMTTWGKGNVSFVGQSTAGVTIYNTASTEGISVTATLCFSSSASNLYLQDLTLQNKAYNNPTASANRFVVVQDKGNKNIYKRVRMLSTQDTYYSNTGAGRSYLEECEIHGTVDFICGGGDIFFDRCLLYLENRANDCIAAPAGTGEWGYVFSNCTIDGYDNTNKNYTLGRAWNKSPRAVYINTTMKKVPTDAAWGNPINAVMPVLFAEYNSRDAFGNALNLSNRRSFYEKNGVTAYVNPVLSASDAAKYTLRNVLSGSDNWQPDNDVKLVSAPKVVLKDGYLKWVDNDSALCYVVFKNDTYVANVATNSYALPAGTQESDVFTVRAANRMGGLGVSSNKVTANGFKEPVIPDDPTVPVTNSTVVFHYNNGSLSSSTGNADYLNLWTCTDSGKEEYGWCITGNTQKSVLYGENISYNGGSYKTMKNSNGAQNTVYLPKDVVPVKITFVGYTNAEDGVATLSEVAGHQVSMPFSVNKLESYGSNPSVVSYEFTEDIHDSFSFTFTDKQVCFIAFLEVKSGEPTLVEDLFSTEEEGDGRCYDMLGRPVIPTEGMMFIRNGKLYMMVK